MIKYLTVEQVVELHDVFLKDHGGLSGIRDKRLLASAVEMPRSSMFGELLHKTIYDQAAAYLFHLVQNHPFNDGNKRTGALTAILFLELNGVEVTFSEDQYEDLVVEVAKGNHTKTEIACFLEHGRTEPSFQAWIQRSKIGLCQEVDSNFLSVP